MSVATQVTTFADLYTDLLNRVRDETNVTATTNLAKRWINTALYDMHIGFGETFPWTERRAVLRTHPVYEEGTVSIAQGSTALAGSGTLWNTNDADGVANVRAGGKIVVAGDVNVFEIDSVSSDIAAVLKVAFAKGSLSSGSISAFADAGGGQVTVTSAGHGLATGMNVTIVGTTSYNGTFTIANVTTDTFEITDTFVADDATGTWSTRAVSGASYRYFEDEYALASDFLRPIDARSFSEGGEIELIPRTEFRRRYVRNHVPGRPRVATLLDLPFSGNTTPVRRVALHPPPDSTYLIPYTYVTSNLGLSTAGVAQAQLVSDTDEPIVPLAYRHAIVLKALETWYRDRKDDVRSAEAKAEYIEVLSRLATDTEVGAKRPSIHPRIGPYWAQARRPYRGSGHRRYDLHGRFDRLQD